MAADAQAVLVIAPFEFSHVSGEIVLQLVDPKTDIAPQFLWQVAQGPEGFVSKFNPITHSGIVEDGEHADKRIALSGSVEYLLRMTAV